MMRALKLLEDMDIFLDYHFPEVEDIMCLHVWIMHSNSVFQQSIVCFL